MTEILAAETKPFGIRVTTEAEDIFAEAAKIYRGYAHYRQCAEHRTIRVFVLESTS